MTTPFRAASSRTALTTGSRLEPSTRLIRSGADDRSIRRAVERGRLIRLAPGCHVVRDEWEAAGYDERFRLRIAAARAVSRSELVLSHAAAALVWDLPWIGPWPERVPATDPAIPSSRSAGLVRWHAHALSVAEVVEHAGFAVTSPARTVADLVLALPLGPAVAVVDRALGMHGLSESDLLAALQGRPRARRLTAARRALEFGDPGAQAASESLSRVGMAQMGFELPALQRRFDDGDGLIGYADCFWETVGIVGECDGDKKYLAPSFRTDRGVERSLLDEKRRHDRLDSHPEVRRVVRWGWREAVDPRRLAARLDAVGVPRLDGAPLGHRRRRAADK